MLSTVAANGLLLYSAKLVAALAPVSFPYSPSPIATCPSASPPSAPSAALPNQNRARCVFMQPFFLLFPAVWRGSDFVITAVLSRGGLRASVSTLQERMHCVQIWATYAVDATVAQIDAPRAVAMMTKPGDAVAAHHLRAMDADEAIGVHPRLQRLARLVDQPASRADVQPHIVALRLDQVYLPGVDPQHLAAVLDPEFGDPLALALGRAHV